MSLLDRFGATERTVGNGIGTLITAPLILRCWTLSIPYIFKKKNFRMKLGVPPAESNQAHQEQYLVSKRFLQRERGQRVIC